MPVCTHRDHFDSHFNGEKREDNIVENLKQNIIKSLTFPRQWKMNENEISRRDSFARKLKQKKVAEFIFFVKLFERWMSAASVYGRKKEK